MLQKATVISNSNIAFIKYWGSADPRLNLPLNDSLSMNLDALHTTTTVEFDDALTDDDIVINETPADENARARVVGHLDRIRARVKIQTKARIASRSNFPSGTGIASSASAFAALTLAATHAAGLELNERDLTILARQGSGSASRSIPAGFVEWLNGLTSDSSFARSIAPPDFWDLRDCVVIVSREEKRVSSREGHSLARTSPFMSERVAHLGARFHHARRLLLERDLAALGPVLEAEALELHVIAMTSRPPIFYWSPATVRVIQAVQQARAEGLAVFFTLDAGPNVHLICEGKDVEAVSALARNLAEAPEVIVSAPGDAARVIESHLF
jgi:diphosphomevalonate decarboxylase